jgi:hypothetical protein
MKWKPSAIPSAFVLTWAMGLAGVCRAEPMPDSSLLSNFSASTWKIRLITLVSGDPTQAGSIRICDLDDPSKVKAELKNPGDEFTIPPKKEFCVYYLDDSSGGKCHDRWFVLEDADKHTMVLESFRRGFPGTNVYVRAVSHIPWEAWAGMSSALLFNTLRPGAVMIRASEVPVVVPQDWTM